jgi:hypothetical protein
MLDGVDVHGIGSESESKPPKSQKSRKKRDNTKIFAHFAGHFRGDFSAPRRRLGLLRDGF